MIKNLYHRDGIVHFYQEYLIMKTKKKNCGKKKKKRNKSKKI